MKIHQYADKGKSSLTKINKNQPRVLLNGRNISCRLGTHEFIKDADAYLGNLKTADFANLTIENRLTVSSYNRLGYFKPFDIISGDIAIIGSDLEDLNHLSIKIVSTFKKNNIPIKETSAAIYLSEKLSGYRKNIPEHRLVIINANKTIPEIIQNSLKLCTTRIVFAIDELKLLCGLSGVYKDSGLMNNIIASLGGDFDVRKRFISSFSKGEFLVATDTNEQLQSLCGGLSNQTKFNRR